MIFSEDYEQPTTGTLAVENAADILGLDDRTAWGWNARYNDEGPEAPDHSIPLEIIMQTLELQ